jgi:hypothetical protein
MFHTSDPWSPYKSKGHTTKGRHRAFLERDLENKSEASLRQLTEAEFPRWKTSSQEWDALGGFGEVWKHRSVEACVRQNQNLC